MKGAHSWRPLFRGAGEWWGRSSNWQGDCMSTTTILIILVIFLLLGGGWGYSRRG